ncbi:MAG TPA: NDP-sugar synthase [Actinomycetota bacterium]|nr:NDP-sugar synthase [Actinomycetota bacterium]
MKAVVLAAGAGERQGRLSEERLKPLLPTLDITQLEWNLSSLSLAGASTIYVNTNRHAEQIVRVADRTHESLNIDLRMSHEPGEPLGTAGALRNLRDELDSTFIVVNGDVLCDEPIDKLVTAHASAGAACTLFVVADRHRGDFVIENDWVTGLVDRRESREPGWVYTGIGIFEPSLIELIPEGPIGLYESVLTAVLQEGRGMACVELAGYWRDVGTPEAHLLSNLEALSGAFSLRSIPGLLGTEASRNDPLAYVGQGAEISGCDLRHCVVGSGARVGAGSRLHRCVVWDNTDVATGDYSEVIITPRGITPARLYEETTP